MAEALGFLPYFRHTFFSSFLTGRSHGQRRWHPIIRPSKIHSCQDADSSGDSWSKNGDRDSALGSGVRFWFGDRPGDFCEALVDGFC